MNAPFELPTIVKVPLPFSPYAPKAWACQRPDGKCGYDVACDVENRCVDMSSTFKGDASPVNLKKLESDLSRNPLDEIAAAVRKLTFGEMHELADGIWGARPGDVIESDALPGMLHKWSVSRG